MEGCRVGIMGALAWGHVQQIVAHPVVLLGFVEGVVVHHGHFVVVLRIDRKPLSILIHLVRLEGLKGSVHGDVGDCPLPLDYNSPDHRERGK